MSVMAKVTFTTDDHRRFFAEFCKWELASGGPDSQLPTVAEMAQSSSDSEEERLWKAFCYIGVYNVPYGEVMWRNWSFEAAWSHPTELRTWLDGAYDAKKITTRMERRSCRRSFQMNEYLFGARHFIDSGWSKLVDQCKNTDPYFAYEIAWKRINQLPTVGRYAAIKLIEYLRRYHGLAVSTPDIRPKDAWSPRHTLGYIFPERGLGNKDNSLPALGVADQACKDAITMLRDEFDVHIDMFQLQVLLCEYRESWESKKQYPGRSLDSELKYAIKAQDEWNYRSDIWNARAKLFPHEHLGELNGWDGTRKDVAVCLATHLYTWTDLLYDYIHTKDMTEPLKWVRN
jgi:hypothetical protein